MFNIWRFDDDVEDWVVIGSRETRPEADAFAERSSTRERPAVVLSSERLVERAANG